MKELAPTHPRSSCLVLFLTTCLLATAACSSTSKALPEAQTRAGNASGSTQQRTQVAAAMVTTRKAKLRRGPSSSADVVTIVNKGALLTLLEARRIGPWYRVRDSKTDGEGWINGNAIVLLQPIEAAATPSDEAAATPSNGPTSQGDPSGRATDRNRVANSASAIGSEGHATATVTPTPAQRPRQPSPSGRSYVNVDGVRVPSPVFTETKPPGATARCQDGSYSFSQHRRGTCSHHGGVAEWF